jgi:hypothetical protein
MKMSMEQWWNDTDRGKLKYSDKKFVHLKINDKVQNLEI